MPIYSGQNGALIKIRSPEGWPRVLKLLPPSLAAGQIAASEALSGQSFPLVCRANVDDGWMIIEFVDGQPWPKHQAVDFSAILRAILPLWHQPLVVYQRSFRQLLDTWIDIDQRQPSGLQELHDLVGPLSEAATVEPWHHLHGDFGIHNLFCRRSTGLLLLDPSGVVGPQSWDLGSLAAWGGTDREHTYELSLWIWPSRPGLIP